MPKLVTKYLSSVPKLFVTESVWNKFYLKFLIRTQVTMVRLDRRRVNTAANHAAPLLYQTRLSFSSTVEVLRTPKSFSGCSSCFTKKLKFANIPNIIATVNRIWFLVNQRITQNSLVVDADEILPRGQTRSSNTVASTCSPHMLRKSVNNIICKKGTIRAKNYLASPPNTKLRCASVKLSELGKNSCNRY